MRKHRSIIIIIAIIALAGVFAYSFLGETETKINENFVIYTDEAYGFKLAYPRSFGDMKISPSKECEEGVTWDGRPVERADIGRANNLSISIVCDGLTDGLINQFGESGDPEEINIDGRDSYAHYFISPTQYEWRVLQVPIDDEHYLEVAYFYIESFEYAPFPEEEWKVLVDSIEFN